MTTCDSSQCPELILATNSMISVHITRDKLVRLSKQLPASPMDIAEIIRYLVTKDIFFYVLIHKKPKSSALSIGRSKLSVQSNAIQVINHFPREYTSCKRGKVHSSISHNSSLPLLEQLVFKSI